MDTTPILGLPLIMPSQAQKHVTHNEALTILDGIVQLAVIDRHLIDPPAAPAQGDRYLVPAGATGEWAGSEDQVAVMLDGTWSYLTPKAGWRCWVEADDAELLFDGQAWIDRAIASFTLNDLAGIGINGSYNEATPLVVQGDTSLFSGSGSHQLKINKAEAGDTASVLFQTAYSGRAEFGTAGDDDFHVKVSDDGTTWREALVISRSNGAVTFPNSILPVPGINLIINSAMKVNQRDFTGGSLSPGTYGYDRWKAGSGSTTVDASGGQITISSGEIIQMIEAEAFGLTSFAGLPLVFSLGDLDNPLRVTVAGTYQDIGASQVQQSVAFTVPGGHSGPLELKLAPISGVVSFRAPKLETGAFATAFQENPLTTETLLCYRYYWKLKGTVSLFLYAQGVGNYLFNNIPTSVPMRQTPAVTRALAAYGNLLSGDPLNATTTGLSPSLVRLSIRSNAAGECYANFDDIACDAEL